ncbi:serine/threonine-protein kinase rio2 isoform X2 [Momordica charantia]|uniref:Serine/threonine-protein kinase RIO2 n=1 Tax=Momordica charantia TaxID=3673 RepID=A0A6J1DEY7_MOMCH|nr:serine/threonine-protein kinase rio2 isoform X2 [Momordica charantia]
MKLDVNVLRYLSKDDFRVLTAVEMGMRNHEIVPSELVDRIASLKHGGTYKVMKNLLKYKLLHHDSSKYDGFRLTYLGYDFLAIKTLVNRGVFVAVGRQIGVGKESDIFEVAKEDGTVLAMKLHRLGRISFRSVKSKRDYLRHRSSYNWLYLSRLAAVKEFAFMKALEEHGFPVPNAVDCNRHCVIMSLVQGYPLVQVKELQNPDVVFETILGLVVHLAEHGLIHCDFNEFNIMIDNDEKVTMIDFPQMVSVSHRNAQMYFDRDVECIFKFFRKRFNLSFHESGDDENDVEVDNDESARPCFSSIAKGAGSLDKDLAASGFTRKDQEDMEKFIEGGLEGDADSGDEEAESSKLDKMDNNVVEHLQLSDEETLNGDENAECQSNYKARHNDVFENDSDSDNEEANGENDVSRNGSSETRENDNGEGREENDETELNKRLNKQRRRAIASASGGRKARASRNTYKDKGRKSSNNSKLQKQIGIW